MRGPRAGHAGRRPSLRHARLRLGPARPGGDSPCGPERTGPAQRDRRSHHPASGLRAESAPAQDRRRGVRLDEDGRGRRQAALLGPGPQQALVRTDRRRLQPHPHGQPRGDRRVAEPCIRGLKHRIQRSGSRPLTYRTSNRSLLSLRPLVEDGQVWRVSSLVQQPARDQATVAMCWDLIRSQSILKPRPGSVGAETMPPHM